VIDDKGAVALNDAGSVAAVEWFAGLLKKGYIRAKMNRFDARQLFAQGKVGFYDDAIAARSLAASGKPKDAKLTVVPLARPVLKAGDKPQALLWGHIVVVIEGDQADSAAAFAKYITTDQATAVNYFEKLSLPPTVADAIKAESVQKDSYVSTWTTAITTTARANPFWPYAQTAQMEKILGEKVQEVLLGSTGAQAALDAAQEDIADLVK
jgi:ABC-type glycerol-3-phosphate transport system substrate-binding protein